LILYKGITISVAIMKKLNEMSMKITSLTTTKLFKFNSIDVIINVKK